MAPPGPGPRPPATRHTGSLSLSLSLSLTALNQTERKPVNRAVSAGAMRRKGRVKGPPGPAEPDAAAAGKPRPGSAYAKPKARPASAPGPRSEGTAARVSRERCHHRVTGKRPAVC